MRKTRLTSVEVTPGEHRHTEQAQCDNCEEWTDLDQLTRHEEEEYCPHCAYMHIPKVYPTSCAICRRDLPCFCTPEPLVL